MINKNELYNGKNMKDLSEWKEDLIYNFKLKASNANTDVQLSVNKYIEALDRNIKERKEGLAKQSRSSDGSWGSINNDLKAAWLLLKSAAKNASTKI